MNAKKQKKERATVLVADDESGIRDVFVEMISELGYRVVTANNSEQATKLVRSEPVSMAFIDNWMPPGIDGIEAIKQWKEEGLLSFPAVVVTGFAKIESAVDAMRYGAFDVLSKPIKREQVEAMLNKAKTRAETEIFDPNIRGLDLGKSDALTKTKGDLLRAAARKGPVAMVGGANDGCELFALFLHPPGKPWVLLSDRRAIEANPTARLSEARHGTIYVKNVDGMTPVQQRGLELMARNAAASDTWVFCEMREPVEVLVKKGLIEDGLAEMLSPLQVNVPPLAEYENDLGKVFSHVIQRLCLVEGMDEKGFSKEASGLLLSDTSRWASVGLDGLVAVARVLLRGAANSSVEEGQVAKLLNSGVPSGRVIIDESIFDAPLRESRRIFERIYLEKLLDRHDNNYMKAAKSAGIDRAHLYHKVKEVIGAKHTKEV